jgi:hypothetical protein
MLRTILRFDGIAQSGNYFNYINMTNPDTSGMLRFVTDELQDAEDAGDRGWSSSDLYLCDFPEMIMSFSLDPWTRPYRLGWY